ncbi:uncharacterized protein EI90DRAFT_3285753 [Cantharellus anzutake]|uniref:uncharacterized protein n=1 Tax=Cantharellus anzutake TaxID=1750568 RepID=UPI001903C3F2|nr:uncharacterized protein EI90DRAFT_3285753 [Cantharellus anzutake]KAF8340306.1 hypothetical protein EI90DRAFT_3285753 [Cantharellus anzutake]
MSLPTPTASLASSFTNKGGQGSPTSPTSPLSYFLGSPTAIKSGFAGAYGGIGGGIGPQKNIPEGSAVSEEDDTPIGPRTRLGHARAGSVNWPSGMGHDRASGVMRRLSLSGALSGVRGMPAQQSSPPRAPSPPQAPAQIKSVERPPSPGLRPRSKKSNLTKKRSWVVTYDHLHIKGNGPSLFPVLIILRGNCGEPKYQVSFLDREGGHLGETERETGSIPTYLPFLPELCA